MWVEFENRDMEKEHRNKYKCLYIAQKNSHLWTNIFAVKRETTL